MDTSKARLGTGDEALPCGRSPGMRLLLVPKLGNIIPEMGTIAPRSRVAAALFPATRRAVLALFFGNPERRFYLNEVVRASGVGTGSVQRELERLTEAGLITKTRDGRLHYFQANQRSIIFGELNALVNKTIGIVPLIAGALKPLSKQIHRAFVFGSMARSGETDRSDLDLMIVGDVSIRNVVQHLLPAQERLGRDINPSVLTSSEFQDRLAKGDGFLTRVMSQPRLEIMSGADGAE